VHLVRSHYHKHPQEQLAPHFNSYLLQWSDGLRERTALRLFFRLQLEVYQVEVGYCQDRHLCENVRVCFNWIWIKVWRENSNTHPPFTHVPTVHNAHTYRCIAHYGQGVPRGGRREGGGREGGREGASLSFLQVIGIFDMVIIGSPTPLILPALGKTISQKWAKLLQESIKISKQDN